MALVLAYKKGKVPASEVDYRVKDIADAISMKDLEDFVSTPTNSLPERLRKMRREIIEQLQETHMKKKTSTAIDKSTAPLKLKSLVEEKWLKTEQDENPPISKGEQNQYLEAIKGYGKYSKKVYRESTLEEMTKHIGSIVEFASRFTTEQAGDWFDGVTVSRHMKRMQESYKLFEKTAKEMTALQQRLEACYEDIGSTLGKYYDIEGGEEAQDTVQRNMQTEGYLRQDPSSWVKDVERLVDVLDKDFPNYNHKTVTSWNRVYKQLRSMGVANSVAGGIAHDYAEYRRERIDRKEVIKRILDAFKRSRTSGVHESIRLTESTARPLYTIAQDIRRDWKNVNFGAKPYLSAMSELDSIDDGYGEDSAYSIVAYFLSNATSWRGETAKQIKAELKSLMKTARRKY